MVAKFFIKVFLIPADKIQVNLERIRMISHRQRELINKAVQSLNDINHSMGFSVISQQTLEIIMKEYISKYNAPVEAGRSRSPEDWPPIRVIGEPKPTITNVISINRRK
jgi:hypothetical protein